MTTKECHTDIVEMGQIRQLSEEKSVLRFHNVTFRLQRNHNDEVDQRDKGYERVYCPCM